MGGAVATIGGLEPERIVVGLPLTLRGEHGAQAGETLEFVHELEARCPVPIETYDERFTTAIAAAPGRRPDDDAVAAAHLLEGYLHTVRRLVLLAVLVAAVVGVLRGAQLGRLGSRLEHGGARADPHGKPIPVLIPPGADASEIADILEQRGVIDDGGRFRELREGRGARGPSSRQARTRCGPGRATTR